MIVGGGVVGFEFVVRFGVKYGWKWYDIILVECNCMYIWKLLLYEVVIGLFDVNMDEVGYCGYCYCWGYCYFNGML